MTLAEFLDKVHFAFKFPGSCYECGCEPGKCVCQEFDCRCGHDTCKRVVAACELLED